MYVASLTPQDCKHPSSFYGEKLWCWLNGLWILRQNVIFHFTQDIFVTIHPIIAITQVKGTSYHLDHRWFPLRKCSIKAPAKWMEKPFLCYHKTLSSKKYKWFGPKFVPNDSLSKIIFWFYPRVHVLIEPKMDFFHTMYKYMKYYYYLIIFGNVVT